MKLKDSGKYRMNFTLKFIFNYKVFFHKKQDNSVNNDIY